MQHHDGITATSKTHIERLFKQRMRDTTAILTKTLQRLTKQSSATLDTIVCQLFEQNNICTLGTNAVNDYLTFKILHEGKKKKERVEIVFPEDVYFKMKAHDFDVFCIDASNSGKGGLHGRKNCRMVFEAVL